MDEFELQLPEVPEIPDPSADLAAQVLKLKHDNAAREARILVLEARLRFVNEATRLALEDMNKQLDSMKRERDAERSERRTSHAEGEALARALAVLLDLMHVEQPEDMTPERAGRLLVCQREAREVLTLYYERHAD